MLRVAMAKKASRIMTTVIADTTEAVVFEDRLSVLGRTRSPKWQATRAMNMPNTAPLASPIQRLAAGTTRGNVWKKNP